jgi:exopolysaccharide production protein ExoZ
MEFKRKKLGLLQIFRGIAAVLVVAYHLTRSGIKYFNENFLSGLFAHGDIGVDFFFVLSGFIITYVHFKDLLNRSNLYEFLRKRFIRIYPIYWIIATAYLLLLILVANGKTSHHDHQINLQSINDWLYILGCYLLIPQQYDFFLGVAWTLSYEVLFYIAFFIGIAIGFRKAKYLFAIWTVVILTKITLEIFAPTIRLPNVLLLNVRIIEFLTGCIVAYVILKSFQISKLLWVGLMVAGITFLFVTYPNWIGAGWGILMLAIVNGLLIYKIVYLDLEKDIRYPRLLLLIGEASYSIYLSHIIFLSLFLRLFKALISKYHFNNYLGLQVIYIIILVCVVSGGVLVYKYIESPTLKFLNKK